VDLPRRARRGEPQPRGGAGGGDGARHIVKAHGEPFHRGRGVRGDGGVDGIWGGVVVEEDEIRDLCPDAAPSAG